MERPCDECGDRYEAKTRRSKFCSTACRVAASRSRHAEAARADATGTVVEPPAPPSTKVADALRAELEQLQVADSYEGTIAIGIAKQLDSGHVVGAAYVSLSKELDRRVDALRLKAERPDDPARAVRDRLTEKRLSLVVGGS